MTSPPPDETTRKAALIKAFTLIELSVVLVIIGLIVGGVLVGQDLIHAATIRATITQKERFSTAANTFRTKFGDVPGSLVNPTALGLPALGCPSGTCNRTSSGTGTGLFTTVGLLA